MKIKTSENDARHQYTSYMRTQHCGSSRSGSARIQARTRAHIAEECIHLKIHAPFIDACGRVAKIREGDFPFPSFDGPVLGRQRVDHILDVGFIELCVVRVPRAPGTREWDAIGQTFVCYFEKGWGPHCTGSNSYTRRRGAGRAAGTGGGGAAGPDYEEIAKH